MGMGDKKKPFEPKEQLVRCDVTLKRFPHYTVRECPDPEMIRKYGTGGIANVCIYVCYKCKYARRYRFHGGIGCSYGLEDRISSRKKR